MEKVDLKEEELIKNVIYYVAVISGKQPVRKFDIIKHSMNNQAKDFKEVIAKVERDLRLIFGLHLIGLKGTENFATCGILEATSFIVINKFRQHILALVSPDQSFSTDVKKAALLLILSCSYMMNQPLGEETILEILDNMNLTTHLCKDRGNIGRFLKAEYVEPLYLTKYETKESDTEAAVLKYGWGIRAEVEFSKYAILKFVAPIVGKKPVDFPDHFGKFSEEEFKQIDEEDERFRSGNVEDGDEANLALSELLSTFT